MPRGTRKTEPLGLGRRRPGAADREHGAVGLSLFRGAPKPGEARFVITSMPDTGHAAGGSPVTVSPDGRWIAAARLTNTSGGIYVLPLGAVTPKVLLEGHIAWSFFWAPDSQSFAFFEDGKLKTSDVSGAPPQTLSDAPFPVGGGAWSKRGVIVFSSGGVLYRVQAAGTADADYVPGYVTSGDRTSGAVLPAGWRALSLPCTSSQPTNSAVYVGSIDSKERTRLFASESPAMYAAPGYLFFNRGNAVFAAAFRSGRAQADRRTDPLSDAAFRLGARYRRNFEPQRDQAGEHHRVSNRRARLSQRQHGERPGSPKPARGCRALVRSVRRLPSGRDRAAYAGVDLAPDGKRFAVHQHEGDGGDSWFFDSGQDAAADLQHRAGQLDAGLVARRNQDRLRFQAQRQVGTLREGLRRNRPGGVDCRVRSAEDADELVTRRQAAGVLGQRSEDRGDLWMVPRRAIANPCRSLQTPADESLPRCRRTGSGWRISPTKLESQIYVRPFRQVPATSRRSRLKAAHGRDGEATERSCSSTFHRNIMAADIRITGSSVQPGVPHILFPHGNPSFRRMAPPTIAMPSPPMGSGS